MQKTNILKKFTKALWPIELHEMKLFMPMALIIFCLLFNFSALRAIKDSLVVPAVGAEVISFLKLWLVLPSAIMFTLIYVKLSNSYSMENIFYIIVTFFLIFFLLFAFIVYPNEMLLHPSEELIKEAIYNYPYLQWIIRICGKWSYAVMYIICELWSVVVINLMYWQFANNMFNIKDAKRFYPALGMIGNLGLIVAGNVLIACANNSEISIASDMFVINSDCAKNSEAIFKHIVIVVTISGIIAILTFKYLNNLISGKAVIMHNKDNLMNNLKLYNHGRTKLSLKDSIKLILRSEYISRIAIMVICYGLSINILEGPWKAQIKELYPTTQEYITFMGKFNVVMGISCVMFMGISSSILHKFNWLFPALITPLIIGVTGIIFFLLIITGETASAIFSTVGYSPIYLAVLVGASQNILSKSSKCSLFDATKEIAYIPLDAETKIKGKAAVEVVGVKLGKSGGAFIQFLILTLYPESTISSISAILMGVFILVVLIWLIDVVSLYHKYDDLQQFMEKK